MREKREYPKYTKTTKADRWAKAYITQCSGKVAYRTIDRAKTAAQKALKERGAVLHCYLCPHCLNYHLTRSKIDKWKRKVF